MERPAAGRPCPGGSAEPGRKPDRAATSGTAWPRARPGTPAQWASRRTWQCEAEQIPTLLERVGRGLSQATAPLAWERGCLQILKKLPCRSRFVRSSMNIEDDRTSCFAGAFE